MMILSCILLLIDHAMMLALGTLLTTFLEYNEYLKKWTGLKVFIFIANISWLFVRYLVLKNNLLIF